MSRCEQAQPSWTPDVDRAIGDHHASQAWCVFDALGTPETLCIGDARRQSVRGGRVP